MPRKKNNPLRVVTGGTAKDGGKFEGSTDPTDDGSEYVCSKLIVAFCIDKWKNGRKVDEWTVAQVPILASDEGDTPFGNNIEGAVSEIIDRIKTGKMAPNTPQ